MSFFSSIMNDPSKHPIGIDCTGPLLRFIRLSFQRSGKIQLAGYGSQMTESGVVHDGDIINRDAYGRSLSHMLTKGGVHRIKSHGAFAAVSERHTFLKMISVPPTEGDASEAIRWEATQHIPYELHDLYIDWTTIGRDDKNKMAVLVAAAPKYLSDTVDGVIRSTGMTALAIEPSALSIARACAHQCTAEGTDLVVHLGLHESVAIIVKKKTPILSSLLHSTYDGFRRTLKEKFSIKDQDADKALTTLGYYKLRAHGTIRTTLAPQTDELQKRLTEIENYYNDHFSDGQPIHSIILSGPGTLIAGIIDELTERLRRSFQVAVPPPNLRLSRHTNSFASSFHQYVVPLGAALRQQG